MHRVLLFSVPLLFFYAAAASAVEPRFSGSAGLDKPATSNASANGRYSISADLRPATAVVQSTSRYSLNAKLQPDAKSIATACGPVGDSIFKNGFE